MSRHPFSRYWKGPVGFIAVAMATFAEMGGRYPRRRCSAAPCRASNADAQGGRGAALAYSSQRARLQPFVQAAWEHVITALSHSDLVPYYTRSRSLLT